MLDASDRKPGAFELVFPILLQYAQVRHVYDIGHFWEPELHDEPAPVR